MATSHKNQSIVVHLALEVKQLEDEAPCRMHSYKLMHAYGLIQERPNQKWNGRIRVSKSRWRMCAWRGECQYLEPDEEGGRGLRENPLGVAAPS